MGLGATTLKAVTAPAKGPPPSLSSTNSVLPRPLAVRYLDLAGHSKRERRESSLAVVHQLCAPPPLPLPTSG